MIFVAAAVSAVLALIVIAILSNTMLSVSRYDISGKKLPPSFDGYKIIHLSDLHSKSFGKNNERLLRRVKKENPDAVCVTGDMVNKYERRGDFAVFFDLVNRLAALCDVYYVSGNHEQSLPAGEQNLLLAHLEKAGVTALQNNKTAVTKGGESIALYGLAIDLKYYLRPSKYKDLGADKVGELLGKADDTRFNILLAHHPKFFEGYAEWGADLTLSGHIHGGMVRLPFIGGLLSPEKKFFPKYDAGLFSENGRRMVLSRGLGSGRYKFRFLNPPEIVVVTLAVCP